MRPTSSHPRYLSFQYPLFRIELLSLLFPAKLSTNASFNIRSFGSNCSAFCNECLLCLSACFNIRSFGSNCSAASRITVTLWPFAVSISALSDRIAQQAGAIPDRKRFAFQYPLFRIELLSLSATIKREASEPVSISALSDRIAQLVRLFSLLEHGDSFNIRSFGSNCSASNHCWYLSIAKFQYPLFRIELLSFGQHFRAPFGIGQFQYPLFRIELLS